MINHYKKKPVIVEAVQLNLVSWDLIWEFVDKKYHADVKCLSGNVDKTEFRIKTLEGTMLAREGDYIIKGINGEFYPCKKDIFEKTYEVCKNYRKKIRSFKNKKDYLMIGCSNLHY